MILRDSALSMFTAAIFLTAAAQRPESDRLRRRAHWGFRMVAAAPTAGAEVRSVVPGTPAAEAGLRDGDRILRVGELVLGGPEDVAQALRAHRGGDRVRLVVRSAEGERRISFVLPALPLENLPGCEVSYGSVVSSRGDRVRTILTRPSGAVGRLPTIVFVPWLSCDPVESPLGPGDGWMQILHGLALRSGWALYRIEKPGVGDSEGADCSQNDLSTDVAAFRAGLDAVRGLEGVDTSRIVIFGGSIGGALAPLLAAEQPVAGLIVAGGFSRTWFEHMLEIERQRLTLSGESPAAVNRALRGFAEFYALYLGGLTPGEVIARRPDLAPLWYDSPAGQYGRPASYYHEVARLNVEEAWSRIDAPVLVLHGEYDWIMSRAEAERVAEIVNSRGAGRAELAILPKTDHNLLHFASRQDAFDDRSGRFDDSVVTRVVEWLHAHVAAGAPTEAR